MRYVTVWKQKLDDDFNKQLFALKEHGSFYGRVIQSKGDKWLIEDCNKKTLLEIEKEILANLTPKTPAMRLGTLIALKGNNKGQIVKLLPLNKYQPENYCAKA